MYQQHPLASMGGADLGDKIKTISREDLGDPVTRKRIRAWDLSATEGAGDWSAGPLMSRHLVSGDIVIEDMQRFQKSPLNTEIMITTNAEHDGHGVMVRMEQEPGSSGVIVIDHYKALLAGYSFDGEKATGPPEVRCGPFLAACESGKVKMVTAEWNQALRAEINGFPDGENDDQLIACALAYNKLVKGLYGGLTWGREGDKSTNVIPISRRTKNPPKPTDNKIISGCTW